MKAKSLIFLAALLTLCSCTSARKQEKVEPLSAAPIVTVIVGVGKPEATYYMAIYQPPPTDFQEQALMRIGFPLMNSGQAAASRLAVIDAIWRLHFLQDPIFPA